MSKDQKNVYCVADGSTVLWYKLGADGAPVKAGELACKGNDAWTLVIAPDGKHLYNMSRAVDRLPGNRAHGRTRRQERDGTGSEMGRERQGFVEDHVVHAGRQVALRQFLPRTTGP